jgi:hypothetical protein
MDAQQAVQAARELLVWAGPLVAGGALTKVGEGTVDQAGQLVKRAWSAMAGWLARDTDAADDLRKLEKQPESVSRQQIVAEAVAQVAAHDAAVAAELEALSRALASLKGITPGRSHQINVSDNAQVGTAIAGDVHGNITHTQQSGGVNFGSGNKIEKIGDVVAGDKVDGDKVLGDKIMHYDAAKPADTGPEHIGRLIDMHTRRLRVLEEQAARTGYNARPEVQTEIEDIRAEVARLQAQHRSRP